MQSPYTQTSHSRRKPGSTDQPLHRQTSGSPLPRGRQTESAAASLSLRRLPGGGGAVFLDTALEFRAEMADQALYRPHRAVGQGADRVAFDFARRVLQHVDLGYRSIADDHPLHDPPHPAGALAARGALAAALVLVEL